MLTKNQNGNLLELIFYNERANCLSPELIKEFKETLIWCEGEWKTSGSPAAILVSAKEEKVFSAGADLAVYRDLDEAGVGNYLLSLGELLLQIACFPLPIITKIGSLAVGGALGLIAASDFVIASKNAQFRLPELELGLAPSVISPFLLSRIGSGFLRSISFSGEVFDVAWAYNSGLVSEIVEGGEAELSARSQNIASNISARNQSPVAAYKRALTPLSHQLPEILKDLAINNAKSIVEAKKRGVFSKKS